MARQQTTSRNLCYRVDGELAALLNDYVRSNGLTISSVTRAAILSFFEMPPDMTLINTRAYRMCTQMLRLLGTQLPATFEDAVTQGLLDPNEL